MITLPVTGLLSALRALKRHAGKVPHMELIAVRGRKLYSTCGHTLCVVKLSDEAGHPDDTGVIGLHAVALIKAALRLPTVLNGMTATIDPATRTLTVSDAGLVIQYPEWLEDSRCPPYAKIADLALRGREPSLVDVDPRHMARCMGTLAPFMRGSAKGGMQVRLHTGGAIEPMLLAPPLPLDGPIVSVEVILMPRRPPEAV